MVKLLDDQLIAQAALGDIGALKKLDRHGLFPAPGENALEFTERLRKLQSALQSLDNDLKKGVVEVAPGIKLSEKYRIPPQISSEALETTGKLYNVRPDWVPGFFADESFGLLWGGCALSDPASGLVLFIIRKIFRSKRRFLVYDRRELMAHEMIHAAHQSIDQLKYEEYFAYRSAKSLLRRTFGGCFVQKYDAMCFLLPILLLPVMQFLNVMKVVDLPMWIFYLLAAVYPVFLVLRCGSSVVTAARARAFLEKSGAKQPDAVLFRMTAEEIKALSRKKMPAGDDLRWQIIVQYLKGE